MSLKALTAIWSDPPCKAGDLLCLLAIADNADDQGRCWPSMTTIARKAAMSERGARKCVRNLEAAGLIRVEIGGGRGGSSSYQITTNGMGEFGNHKNPEQSSPHINPEQSSENPELYSRNNQETRNRATVNPEPGFRRTTIEPSVGGGGSARESATEDMSETETYRERLLSACGVDPVSGLTGHGGSRLGTRDQMIVAQRWISDLGLPEHEIIEEIVRLMQRKRDGPPKSLVYFTEPLARLAGQIHQAQSQPMSPQNVTPLRGSRNDRTDQRRSESDAIRDAALRLTGEGGYFAPD